MRRRPIRTARRAARGQVMLLFALMAVLLLVIGGLAIDAGMSYFSSDQLERAAAAAALAGVAYLPGDVPAADNAALVEASRNGFTNGKATAVVSVQQPTGTTNELEVSITVSVPTTFLSLVGFPAHPVKRTATAEFLPPVALGQPGAAQGSVLSTTCNGVTAPYCANPTTGLGSSGSFYFERSEGYGNPRSEGDPYTPTPLDEPTSCGTPAVSCVATTPLDYHPISPAANTEKLYSSLDLNYTGGSSYLITVPPGQSVDVQVYNPSFAPDSNDQSNTDYTYHEDDGSFPIPPSTKKTDYAAMSYTIFTVPTLSSDLGDAPISQEVFYPFNATCIYNNGASCGGNQSYTWFPGGAATTVSGVPNIYHAWTSVLDTPAGNDSNLFTNTLPYGSGELSNPASNANPLYFRLEVDTLQYGGVPICANATCAQPQTGTAAYEAANGQSTAHKGYAVQLVAPNSSSTCSTATPPAPTDCPTATMSSMGDMTVFTPMETGGNAGSFSIPLFKLDPSYANQTIDVDIFDIGDVSFTGGPKDAYVGIQEPDGTTFASPTTITALGNTISAGGAGNVLPAWGTAACGGAGTACFLTSAGGGSKYNGQWVRMQITVPSTVSNWNDYWSLVYYVTADAQAGDTFAVQVGFAGSPDRLLP